MKNKLVPILFFSFLFICGWLQSKSQENGTLLKDTLTNKHSNFPETGIYMILPKGFAYNYIASGFLKDADGSVIKYDAFKKLRYDSGMPVKENSKDIIQEQKINISGYQGKIITYKDGKTFTRHVLSFGDGTFMEFIEAKYFSHRKQTGKDILAAFETIVYKRKN